MERNALISMFVVCCCFSLNGQGLGQEQIDSIYYNIVNKIVLNDTITNESKEKYFEEELKLSILPQKQRDSIYDIRLKSFEKKNNDSVQYKIVAKYYENELKKKPRTIKQILRERDKYESQKCYLFLQQENKKLKNTFYKQIARGGEMSIYFGKNKLKDIINKFPIENKLNKTRIDRYIKVIKNSNSFGHQFSSPIIIDEKIVIFHLRKYTEDMYSTRILVYELNGNNIEQVEIFEEVNTFITSRMTFDK